MALQQRTSREKAVLEQQAMQLTMEYRQKKAEEEMQKQQYDMEQQKLGINSGMNFGAISMMQPQNLAAPQSAAQQQIDGDGQVYVYGPNVEMIPKEHA